MSKYSDEELKRRAMSFLYLDGANDMRCDMLLQWMSQYYNVHPEVIREKIRELAKYEKEE